MPRVKIGDIIEIPTSKGLAYAHYTHQHPTHGGLIRVFDQLFESRPTDLKGLINQPVRFSTFFPLRIAVSRNMFKVVGHEDIALPNQTFPIFRGANEGPKATKVSVWWLWDGEKEWRYEGPLTPEFYKLPIDGVWNAEYLVHRIEEGWRPENDPRR